MRGTWPSARSVYRFMALDSHTVASADSSTPQ